jgi:AcrR family transcriptional regulator
VSESPVLSHRRVAAGGSGRRERRRAEVRDRVFDAAVTLFVDRGYKATTIDAIAERADVARGTVFNHFPEKVAFLEEWGRRRRAYVAGIIANNPEVNETAAERVRHYLGEMVELNVASREQTAVLMDASARYGALLGDDSLAVALAEQIERGRADGDVRPDVGPAEVGALLASAYFSSVLQWIADQPPPFDLRARVAGMLAIVVRGLAP